MGKAKSQKSSAAVTQKHLHSRISFLYQSASYLSAVSQVARQLPEKNTKCTSDKERKEDGTDGQYSSSAESIRASQSSSTSTAAPANQSRHLVSQLRSISLKSQIRLSQEVKRSICKHCDTLLVPGRTCTERIENSSKDQKKPWADVLVRSCDACGTVKRFPIGATRQKRLGERVKEREGKRECGEDVGETAGEG